ncbi:unnamed protein product [Candida verbasci]|uniref:arginyltransferase n=1 Tax=Candida verbasci TaxID=1227364 RepID=A0A9W4XK83_9ASCO|nr:unnamed protein product [Candida verbasci]
MIFTAPHYFKDRHCGYCKDSKIDHYALQSQWNGSKDVAIDEKESILIGTQILQMSCNEYDKLINQGFRRSGKFLYKPDLLKTCCRLYTIRTSSKYLNLSKHHRKIINKFIKLIAPNLKLPAKNTFDFRNLYEAQLESKNFKTIIEPSKFTKEKFELYKKYQIRVHNDDPNDISENSFRRFLCDTPFPQEEVKGNTQQFKDLKIENWNKENKKRIGPTHELYYLDDKLIAISIMDFLPSGISSIYFIWDPDYAYLSLGTLSGLKEIQMCDKLGYDHYYLGYYIQDCEKMKYKKQFGGEILDLANEIYFPFEKVDKFLNNRLFVIGEKGQNIIQELEVENKGEPIDYEDSDFKDKELINIAEDIYGNDEISQDAEECKQILKDKYKIKVSTLTEVPNIIPGSIPIWQIIEWFENENLDLDFEVELFINGQIVDFKLRDLIPEGRGLIIDCIRIFGLELIQDSVIMVS